MATEFVRVRDTKTGHEYSLPKRFAEKHDGKGVSIIEKSAVDANGRPTLAKTKPRELADKTDQASDAGNGDDSGNTPPATEPAKDATDKANGGKAR